MVSNIFKSCQGNVTIEIGFKIDHGLTKCYELETLFVEILWNYELFTNPLRGDFN